MSVSSRWPSGVGAMVASSPPRFSPQMLIRATSSRSRVVFSEFSCCCEFEIISSYLFLVRHQRCPCDQLDLLWLHLHWEVGPRLASYSNLLLTCTYTALLTEPSAIWIELKVIEDPRLYILQVPWPAHPWGQLGWLPEERRHCQGDDTWIEAQVENNHHVWHQVNLFFATRRASWRTRSTWWCTGLRTTTCTTSSPWCLPEPWRRLTCSSGNCRHHHHRHHRHRHHHHHHYHQ